MPPAPKAGAAAGIGGAARSACAASMRGAAASAMPRIFDSASSFLGTILNTEDTGISGLSRKTAE
jgi:hypothetical protein